jgi:hypothetical protein
MLDTEKMTEKLRQSTSSSKYEHEDKRSSEYDRRYEPTLNMDEEKNVGLDGTEDSVAEEREVGLSGRGRRHSRRSQDSRSLRTTRSHQSRAGGDGYTCFDAEPDNTRPNNSKPGVVTEQPYLVTWDGDADPENPRSMSNLRRWVIVLICSASSLCV